MNHATGSLVRLPTGRQWYIEDSRSGKGAPTALLLHGLGQNHRSFDAVARHLRDKGWRTVLPDFPGSVDGKTPRQYGDMIPGRDVIDDLVSIVQELEMDNFVGVGHSFGGYYALMLAAEPCAEQRISHVVPITPLLRDVLQDSADAVSDAVNNVAGGIWHMHPIHATAMSMTRSGIKTPWSHSWNMGVKIRKRMLRHVFAHGTPIKNALMASYCGTEALAAMAGLPTNLNLVRCPPEIHSSIPITIILGGHGSVLRLRTQRAFRKIMRERGNTIAINDLGEGGHMLNHSRPRTVARIIASL